MDNDTSQEKYDRANDPARVLALSDGVFAIILTLLVLEIHVPDLAPGQQLTDALHQVRPSMTAFLLSFLIAAIAWAGHRDLFSVVQRTDRVLVWLNMLYLLPLSIIPFGASLLARYDRDPVALQMYGTLLVAIALTRLVAWLYATSRPHLLYEPLDGESRRSGAALIAVPGLAYAVATLGAKAAPDVTLAIFFAVPVLYFVAIALLRASAPPQSAERDFT